MEEGLYEKIITNQIKNYLEHTAKNKEIEPIEQEEANIILAKHVKDVVEKALKQIEEDKGIKGEEKLEHQVALTNKLITLIKEDRGNDFNEEIVWGEASMLYALKSTVIPLRPRTPLSQTVLFTNAQNEPSLVHELKLEILSSDKVDLLVSFVKWSGIRCLKDALEEFTMDRKLRVITTSYMGASDYHAIEFLSKLPNTEVKISYDTKRTKHHAKAYLFKRDTGFSTAYIGSSNLSRSAIETGLEWNIKVTERDSLDVLDKFEATFSSYWNDEEFVTFNEEQKDRLKKALASEKYKGSDEYHIEAAITPNYFQKEILEKLKVEREVYGHTKNLVVAATGVGKTVISAFDYKRFRRGNRNGSGRLLFVAHKQEILKQSIHTFRRVLMDWNFGELYYSGRVPDNMDYLFVTIQTFNSQKFYEKMQPDYYDYIIVDEFHHASAKSYQALLSYFKPQILLGLTATPERMDGQNVLEYFDGRIAAQLRLGEAIDNRLLSPFHYFCITDSVDYSKLDWNKGGYDSIQLNQLISGDTQRADLVIQSMQTYLTDLQETTGIGFCTSIKHGEFMRDYFNLKGIPSAFLQGKSGEEEREQTVAELVKGKIHFIFTVDLFNEGVDIPDVNTVLFLRPTESMTIFIQQLGRGLRLADGKECLTVLDYVGQANKEYNYYEKFAALSKEKGKALKEGIRSNNFLLPKGCHLYMEKVAREYILQNIEGYINNKKGILSKIKEFASGTGKANNVVEFITAYNLDFLEIYKIKSKLAGKNINSSYYRLGVEAGVREEEHCPNEIQLGNILGRVSFINGISFLSYLIAVLENLERYKDYSFNVLEETYLIMFHYTVWGDSLAAFGINTLYESLMKLYDNRPIFEETLCVLKYNYAHLSSMSKEDDALEGSALEVHGVYSTDQILAALGKHTKSKKQSFQEGVLYVKEKGVDAFFITLNKVEKHYSPSTMYKDYAISETLFHWQTQSKIGPETPTCQRYIHHKEQDHKILLFVREHKTENGFTSPFIYLGTADYVRHYGTKPVNIVWKLKEALPARIVTQAEKAL